MAGCGEATTGAEIDRIMADARKDAAREQAGAHHNGGYAAWARKDEVPVEPSAALP